MSHYSDILDNEPGPKCTTEVCVKCGMPVRVPYFSTLEQEHSMLVCVERRVSLLEAEL